MIRWRLLNDYTLSQLGLSRDYPKQVILVDPAAKRIETMFLYSAEEVFSEKQIRAYRAIYKKGIPELKAHMEKLIKEHEERHDKSVRGD